jgi:outer membrane lipoprotein-sorting protein
MLRLQIRHLVCIQLVLTVLIAATAVAEDLWTRNWESIKAASTNIHSLQASFTQRKYMKILKRPLVSTGSIFFQAPDRLRWEYHEPIRQVLLVNGSTIKKYIMEGKRLVVDRSGSVEALRMVMQHITSWLRGDFEKDSVFSKELQAHPPYAIVLKPLAEPTSRFIRSITLVPGKNPGVLTRIEIEEFSEASTVIEFGTVTLNTAIADSVFESAQ